MIKYMERFGCVTIILAPFVLMLFGVWFKMTFEVIGENIPQKGEETGSIDFFLPDQATNISFYRGGNIVYYECNVNEKDALEFTSKKKWTMQPIGKEPVEMMCYFFSSTDEPQRSVALKYYENGGARRLYSYSISEGYYYDDMTNRGGYTIIYDSQQGKLFLFMSMR